MPFRVTRIATATASVTCPPPTARDLQEEVLAECASHRPLDEDRLEAAIEDLTRLVNQCRDSPDFDDLKETEEFKAAELLLEESPTTST